MDVLQVFNVNNALSNAMLMDFKHLLGTNNGSSSAARNTSSRVNLSLFHSVDVKRKILDSLTHSLIS